MMHTHTHTHRGSGICGHMRIVGDGDMDRQLYSLSLNSYYSAISARRCKPAELGHRFELQEPIAGRLRSVLNEERAHCFHCRLLWLGRHRSGRHLLADGQKISKNQR